MNNEILGWEIFSITHSAIMSIIIASAFIIGSIVAVKIKYSSKIKGDFSAFAAGIFFAAIVFSLVTESTKLGHSGTMILGFIAGAVAYSVANRYIRKRSKYKKSQDYNKAGNFKGNNQIIIVTVKRDLVKMLLLAPFLIVFLKRFLLV